MSYDENICLKALEAIELALLNTDLTVWKILNQLYMQMIPT